MVLFTIGTWRVGLPAYLDQLKSLGVQRLVDVRGNPQAGRQDELKRSRQFENALWNAGITYEYWGRELGEDAFDSNASSEFAKTCGQLLSIARQEVVCLLGHLHEPQGCHRLQLCEEILKTASSSFASIAVVHLLWRDHLEVRQLQHAEVAAEAAEVLQFFDTRWNQAEEARANRNAPDPSQQVRTVDWKDFDPKMFSDGQSHRFLLPFDTELLWYPKWLSQSEADKLMETVFDNVTFLHPTYFFQDPDGGHATTLIKRGQVRVCGNDCPGAVASEPIQPWSSDLMRNVEDSAGTAFNCFVANHYANGRVVINWHSDSGPGDDEGLGPNPRIGSVSLGAPRTFCLKSKRKVNGRMVHLDIPLTHGSLLFMGQNSQTHWLHSLPADDACHAERINLTFRFFARNSTKHVEGVEHNHEWEAAAGSTRVLLHRPGHGRQVLLDVPGGVTVERLPRFLSAVLPARRGPADVSIRACPGGEWSAPLPRAADVGAAVAAAAARSKGGHPEVRLVGRAGAKGGGKEGAGRAGAKGGGRGGKSRDEASTQAAQAGGRWRQRQAGYGSGRGAL